MGREDSHIGVSIRMRSTSFERNVSSRTSMRSIRSTRGEQEEVSSPHPKPTRAPALVAFGKCSAPPSAAARRPSPFTTRCNETPSDARADRRMNVQDALCACQSVYSQCDLPAHSLRPLNSDADAESNRSEANRKPCRRAGRNTTRGRLRDVSIRHGTALRGATPKLRSLAIAALRMLILAALNRITAH